MTQSQAGAVPRKLQAPNVKLFKRFLRCVSMAPLASHDRLDDTFRNRYPEVLRGSLRSSTGDCFHRRRGNRFSILSAKVPPDKALCECV